MPCLQQYYMVLFMICMELTRTDAVFSRTTVVLFFVQKWKFSKWAETFWWFFLEQKRPPKLCGRVKRATMRAKPTRALLVGQARPGGLCSPRGPSSCETDAKKSWHSTRGFPQWQWGNLCIGVDARSCLCFPGRNLGALFAVLCVGLSIMNMNLLWCYFSTNSRIDRTERIALCYFSTNSWIDRTERITLRWFRTLQTIYSYVLR